MHVLTQVQMSLAPVELRREKYTSLELMRY